MGGQVLLHRILALEARAAKLAVKPPHVPVDGGGVPIQVRPLPRFIWALGAAHRLWRRDYPLCGRRFHPAFVTSPVPVEEELASRPVIALQTVMVLRFVLSLGLDGPRLLGLVFVLDVLL